MRYWIRTDENGKINCISTEKTFDFLKQVETDIDLESNMNDVVVEFTTYDENTDLWGSNIDFEWSKVWQEPEWQFRIFVPTDKMILIADQYPEMLVNLNVPPRNPKYIVNSGSVIYLNNLGEEETFLLGSLDITIENRADFA